jgi:hypothetical protein
MMDDSLIAGKDFIAARKSESRDQFEFSFLNDAEATQG